MPVERRDRVQLPQALYVEPQPDLVGSQPGGHDRPPERPVGVHGQRRPAQRHRRRVLEAGGPQQPGRLLTGEMSPDEAALAAELLGLTVAVACHYFDHTQQDVLDFLAAVPVHDTSGRRQALAPLVGETLTVATNDDGATISVVRSRG